MIHTIYIEEEMLNHPKTIEILEKFPLAHRVTCKRYGEVFNLNNQNFRLQKQKPALILARKHGKKILKTPPDYQIGTANNFYFSHMLNCIYDCRYCFLQGMFRSAHYVVFVNFDDFKQEILETTSSLNGQRATFFSGYDGDSLAFNSITHFAEDFISFFKDLPDHTLEIRTKSDNIGQLLKLNSPPPNVVIAYSLNPETIIQKLEHKTPPLKRRLKALKKLQERGWKIGLRFDPLIYHKNWQEQYLQLFEEVFSELDGQKIHSTTLGPFRLPHPIYKKMVELYPDEPLFFHQLSTHGKGISYSKEIEETMRHFCSTTLLEHISKSTFFPASF